MWQRAELSVEVSWEEVDNDTCFTLVRFGYLIHWIYGPDPGVGTSNTGHFLIQPVIQSLIPASGWVEKGVLINLLCYLTRSHGTTLFFRLLSPTCLGLTDIEVMLKVVCICYLFAAGASKVSNKYLFSFLSSGELVLKPPSTSNHIIFSSQHLYLTYKTRIFLKDRISELLKNISVTVVVKVVF